MSKIFNQNVSVLGELTINPVDSAGNIITIDGANVVSYRTVSELFADMSIVNDKNYIHDQSTPALVWNVTHGLGKKPAIIVVDTADTVVIGKIEYLDINNVTLTFNGSFSGYAYFN